MQTTGWYPANIDPLRIGYYEMLNESTGIIFRAWYSGCMWFRDLHGPTVPLVRIWPWRGLASPATCHAARDGDCSWAHCPQIEDGEPEKSRRHCPLDGGDEE